LHVPQQGGNPVEAYSIGHAHASSADNYSDSSANTCTGLRTWMRRLWLQLVYEKLQWRQPYAVLQQEMRLLWMDAIPAERL